MHGELGYLRLLSGLLAQASAVPEPRRDRTGVGTHAVFGRQLRFDLTEGFPLLTTKRLHFKSIVAELIWFLSGSTNVADLQAMECTIWDEWAHEGGDLGPVYGAQWRRWGGTWSEHDGGIDQIKALVQGLRQNPHSRRHLVSAWNVSDLPLMALPPCHYAFQCFVDDGFLSLMVSMRSVGVFLGLPFNIASYALLTHMLARDLDLRAGELTLSLGDTHLYANHIGQAREQVRRDPRPLPSLSIRKAPSLFGYLPGDISVADYSPHPHIPAPIAV